MKAGVRHICVCICTFRRADQLRRLLQDLAEQETDQRFTFSVLVVDNDRYRSAEDVVLQTSATCNLPIQYQLEPRQNISLARNCAVANAAADYLAFIDDDERPIRRWLATLFDALEKFGVAGVLGPVKPQFDTTPPRWVVKGKFYDRPSYPTGYVIDGPKGRTGNVLLKTELFKDESEPFNPDLLTGEDQDFFRRMISKGNVFIWCEEALAYEVVPPVRWKRSFMLRRALLRGKISLRQSSTGPIQVLKSTIAVPAYAMALPFMLLFGQGLFMKYLVKTFDHAGRLLALIGLNPAKGTYITE
jgi:glycosyltransferase involved in cell wall biosynthesis